MVSRVVADFLHVNGNFEQGEGNLDCMGHRNTMVICWIKKIAVKSLKWLVLWIFVFLSGQRHVQLKTVHYSHYLMTVVFQISSLSLVSLGKPDTSSQPIRFNLPPIGLGHSRFPALLVVCLYPLRALIGVPVVFHSGSSGCCVLFCSFF